MKQMVQRETSTFHFSLVFSCGFVSPSWPFQFDSVSPWSGRDSDLRHFDCLRRRLDHCHRWSICKGLRSQWLYHWFDLCPGSGGSKIYEDCDYGCAISAQGSFRWTGGAREANPANGCPSASEVVQYFKPKNRKRLGKQGKCFLGWALLCADTKNAHRITKNLHLPTQQATASRCHPWSSIQCKHPGASSRRWCLHYQRILVLHFDKERVKENGFG